MQQFLFVFLLYLPFQVALNIAPGIDLASGRALIAVSFAAWLLGALWRRRLLLPLSPSLFFLAGFVAVAGASLLFAERLDFGLRKLLFLLTTAPLAFVVADTVAGNARARQPLHAAIGIGGVLMALLGIAQFFAQFAFGKDRVANVWGEVVLPLFSGRTFGNIVAENQSWFVDMGGEALLRAIAVFPDPHNLGLYLGMALPFAVGQTINPKRQIPNSTWFDKLTIPSAVEGQTTNLKFQMRTLVWLAASALIVASLLLTFSRGAYLALIVSSFFFSFLIWQSLSRAFRVLLISFFLLGAAVLFSQNSVAERFSSTFHFEEGSNVGRLAIWREAADIFQNHFIGGVGLGNYAYAVDPAAGYRSPSNAHSAYLEVAAETGIFGLLFFAAMLAWPLFGLMMRRDSETLPVIAAVAFFAVHSLVETTLWHPANFALLMVMLGFAAVGQEVRSKE